LPRETVGAELKRLYVDREHQGVGLGAGLCATAIDEARGLGYHSLCLDTTFRATAARRLFGKLGFHTIPRYNADPYAEIWMEGVL
jgi:putative acetyltransferase